MKTRVSLKYFVSYCSFEISASTNNFDFEEKIPKKKVYFWSKTQKNEHYC